jgi:prepilin-type processing-associated H-X9-DG protein
MNNWMYNGNNYQARSNPRPTATDFYKIKNTSSEFQIPVFVDCVWHDFLPRATDLPGVNLQDPESGTSADRSLADVAIDRHNRAVNVGFWDAHVEPVKLTNLWTLKWSPTWTRADPQQIK